MLWRQSWAVSGTEPAHQHCINTLICRWPGLESSFFASLFKHPPSVNSMGKPWRWMAVSQPTSPGKSKQQLRASCQVHVWSVHISRSQGWRVIGIYTAVHMGYNKNCLSELLDKKFSSKWGRTARGEGGEMAFQPLALWGAVPWEVTFLICKIYEKIYTKCKIF